MGSNRSRAPLWMAGAAIAFVALLPAAAFAHPGHGSHGFSSGFGHPLFGWDHLLAMVAIGLWAGQLRGRALWILPTTFVATMALGGALAVSGVGLPGVEAGILASVLVLGGLIAAAARLPLGAAAVIVAAFALFHGHAHGTEMPHDLSGAAYGMGFSTATALLHAAGVSVPLLLQRVGGEGRVEWVRFAGAGISLAGLLLIIG